MFVDAILVITTFASAAVGTILNPKRWIKALIITLAFLSAAATLANSYSDERDKQFDRGALAALIADSSPTPEFKAALDRTIIRVAGDHDLSPSFQEQRNNGLVYTFHRKGAQLNDVSAVFAMTDQDRATAFLAYINGQSLKGAIETAMFAPEAKYQGSSWQENTQTLLDHEALIGNVVLDELVSWVNSDTEISVNEGMQPLSLSITATSGSKAITIRLGTGFILQTRGLPPSERDGKVYETFAAQAR